jgi:ABC-type uncharacterized transport system ATPase subunit
MKSLSKLFNRNIQLNNEKTLEQINEKENQIRQILIKNSKSGSLIYAMKTKEFFLKEFQNLSSSMSSFHFYLDVCRSVKNKNSHNLDVYYEVF